MSARLRVAVIGAGHLGRIHARLLSQRTDIELAGIVEPLADARYAASREFATPGVADFHSLPRAIDAAIVATPTASHYEVALRLLRQDTHLLVEKPIAATAEQAAEMVDLAARRQRVLQVGHVERFNPALDAARPYLTRPRYLESVRASHYAFRSTDIGVVLDLMIHDLDIVLSLVDQPVVEVSAFGCTAVGPHEDFAQARLVFANGCVANLTANRVSERPERTLTVHSDGAITRIDFGGAGARVMQPCDAIARGEFDVNAMAPATRADLKDRFFSAVLPVTEFAVEKRNAIQDEHTDFFEAIRHRRAPRVTGTAGLKALDVAERIVAQLVSPLRHYALGTTATLSERGPKRTALDGVAGDPPLFPQHPQRKAA
jgi:predicted dehydrogenase